MQYIIHLMVKTIKISDTDYEYIKAHVDHDRIVSIREAVSLICDKSSEYDQLVTAMNNDVELSG